MEHELRKTYKELRREAFRELGMTNAYKRVGLAPDQLVTPLEGMLLALHWAIEERDRAGILAASAAAAPYVHPKLSASVVQVNHQYAQLDDRTLLLEATALEAKIAALTSENEDC